MIKIVFLLAFIANSIAHPIANPFNVWQVDVTPVIHELEIIFSVVENWKCSPSNSTSNSTSQITQHGRFSKLPSYFIISVRVDAPENKFHTVVIGHHFQNVEDAQELPDPTALRGFSITNPSDPEKIVLSEWNAPEDKHRRKALPKVPQCHCIIRFQTDEVCNAIKDTGIYGKFIPFQCIICPI